MIPVPMAVAILEMIRNDFALRTPCPNLGDVSARSQRVYETIDKRSKKAQEMIARAALDEVSLGT